MRHTFDGDEFKVTHKFEISRKQWLWILAILVILKIIGYLGGF